ncbi:sensor domain-containing diguanylate cyclase [Lacticaseibacillus zhaodongensis]|uniref:sensor domain-containing diguanylate cyclase n=1 Tax=Lacticaseibacillus zhaodongensis TaxID=2668065 RepID=UPI0018B0043E|nr:diguanylate cyclase [Lacticaseibacillus zhaodongensis]
MGMSMNLHLLSLPTWFAQLLIAIFFASGFVSFYQKLWWEAFRKEGLSEQRKIAFRVALMVLSFGVAICLHLVGYEVHLNGVLFHNLGLFILAFPLLDQRISRGEYALRVVGLLIAWSLHHVGYFGQFQFWLSLVLLGLVIAVIYIYSKRIRYSVLLSIGTFTIIALVFWISLPNITAGSYSSMLIAWQAVLMYMAMACVATVFWIQEHNQEEHTAEMTQLANYDTLTNTKTYSLYQRDISAMFDAAKANGEALTLVAIDIDHFKQINDHYGHLAGNAILLGIANTLDEVLHKYGDDHQVYRTGGEEFNILFPQMTPPEVLPVVQECWRTVRSTRFNYENFDVRATLSIGVTALRAEDRSIDSLYKRADDNLYQSKRNGRDAITVEGETRDADTGKPVYATYTFFTQRIVDLDSANGATMSNELLLRCYDYEHDRWVTPPHFDISVEMQIDLMKQIMPHIASPRLSLNLTNPQFLDSRTVGLLSDYMRTPGSPETLIVELTSLPALDKVKQAAPLYQAAGIKIFIDDVGSDNQFDELEPLLPFVNGMKYAIQNMRASSDTDNLDQRLDFWTRVARQYNLMFVVEGIESTKDIQFAHDKYHARYLQGYYFDRPELPRLA